MEVSVIIVTYNSAPCIRDSLSSVLAQENVTIEVIVVDNASTDQTVATVRPFPNRVRLVENQDNRGFGRACNQAFDTATGRYIYLLNPDAQIQGPDGLARLCQALTENPRWGMAGTTLLNADRTLEPPPETDYPGQRYTQTQFGSLPGQIAWVVGASMFMRRGVYAELGGFDPDFFLYCEEIDFCLRLRKKGYEIGFVQDVQVRHIGALSEAGRDPYDVWTRRTNATHLFWRKHFAPEDVIRLVNRDASRARRRLWINSLAASLLPTRSRAWQNKRRYKAIRDESLKFLQSQTGPTAEAHARAPML